TIQFIEWDHEGRALPARNFVVRDDVIFFDALVIKFDPQRVATGDGLRGRSIALFRRVYGEHENPSDGQSIDATGLVPGVFRDDREANPFQPKLWAGCFEYC